MFHFNTLNIGATPIVPPAPRPTLSQAQVCLIGAKDTLRVSFEDLGAIPLPEETVRESTGNVSYQPLPYAEFATATRSIFAEELNAEPLTESYALARDGAQMFGKIVYPFGNDTRRGLSIALRSSYDRSIANQVAGGLDTFICANGMLNGDSMFSLRHTMNMADKLVSHLRDMASGNLIGPKGERLLGAIEAARILSERLDSWGEIQVSDDLFFSYCGILRGHDVITPTLFSKALSYWKACTAGDLHDSHGNRTLASGFQAVTGALHRVAPSRAFSRFAGLDHITQAIADSGGSVPDADIPAFTLNIIEL